MKKKLLISTAIVISALCTVGTAAVFAAPDNTPVSQKEPVVAATQVRESKEESETRAALKKEDQALYLEVLEQLTAEYESNGTAEADSYGLELMKLETEANIAVKQARLRKVVEIVSQYGYCDPDIPVNTFRDNTDLYSDFVIACCDTYNDINITLTMEERVRLHDYLDTAYGYITGFIDEQTDKTMTAYETIEKTITPKYGISQTVQRR